MYTNFGPRAQRGGQPAAPVNPWAQLLHFLPILLLVAFTFLSTQSEPVRPPLQCKSLHLSVAMRCSAFVVCCVRHHSRMSGIVCCRFCTVSMSGPSGRSVMLRYQLLCGTPGPE